MAKQVVEELTRQHVPAVCLPLDEYDVTKLPHERCVVFVASTTGEGTVPDNMRSFWRFLLRKDLPPGSLSAMRHACFGLGDSSYPKFNFAAKRNLPFYFVSASEGTNVVKTFTEAIQSGYQYMLNPPSDDLYAEIKELGLLDDDDV